MNRLPSNLQSIHLYVGIHWLVSGVFMTLFVIRFSLPWGTLGLHMLVILTLHLGLYWLWRLLPQRPIWRVFVAALLSIYWFYLLLLYALNWFSHLNWGSNVMHDFITHLPQQIHSIATTEGISVVLVVAVVIGFWLLLLGLAYALVAGASRSGLTSRFSQPKLVVYSGLFFLFMSAYVSLTYSRDDPRDWVFEPFMSSVALNSSAFLTNRGKMQALQDQSIKQQMATELANHQGTTNVILIIADALRADRLPNYGYAKPTTPFLSSLQADPAYQQVDYFTSTCSESICGIYSILSSRIYAELGFNLFGLAEVLQSAGYKKYFVLSSNHNYNALNVLYGEGFDHYSDGNDFSAEYTLHDDEGVMDMLQRLPAKGDDPAFFYLHLMSSHSLGKNKPPFNRYQPHIEHVPGFVGKEVTEDLERKSAQLANAYDNGILQLDDYLRRLFQWFEQQGYLQDSLVIITGDHGDGLGERGYFFHTWNLFHEDINVPLIWYAPDCQLQNTRYGTHIDIAPTVLDCMGLPIPPSWQGQSLRQAYQENRLTFHQTLREEKTIMVMLETRESLYKLMATQVAEQISDYRLFDYYQDPLELNNMIDEADPNLVARLKAELHREFE